jgi:hypothetical protein
MFGSLTSPKRQRVSERVNTLRLIYSLAFRACILNGSPEHGAVQLGCLLPRIANASMMRSQQGLDQ